MAYRFFILSLFAIPLLHLFYHAPDEPTHSSSQPVNWDSVSKQLIFLREEISRFKAEEKFDSLNLLKSNFDISLKDAPDSIRFRYRSCCMHFGYSQLRDLHDHWSALHYYLLANQNVKNPYTLDEYSWYVENEIASLYTRLADYDKSEYYAQLTEASLKQLKRYDRLSRLYTNKGINQQSIGNRDEAIRYFNMGLRIADSLQYAQGIFSNNLGLGEIYLESSQDSLAGIYLQQADSYLPGLTEDPQYWEKKSGLEAAWGKYFRIQGDFEKCISNYNASLVSLYQVYHTTNHREFAKIYIDLAKARLQFNQIDTAQGCIMSGLQSLLPDYQGKLEDIETSQLYKENSFIELAEVQYELHIRSYRETKDTSDLIKAYSCVKKGLYVNDQMRSYLVLDPSKLTAIRNNKRLTNYGIETLYDLYLNHPNSTYLNELRELFTRSKSILYNEKIKTQSIISSLTPQEKQTRDSIEYVMLGLLDKKYEEHAEFGVINNELIRLQEKLNEIKARHTAPARQVIHFDSYIDYVQTDSALYAYSEFDHHPKISRLGSIRELTELIRRMNQFIALKEVSTDTQISYALYDLLIHPLKIGTQPKIVIIPDGLVSLIPFELLRNDEGEYLLEKHTISYEYQFEPYVLQGVLKRSNFIFCLAPRYDLPAPMTAQSSRGGLYELPYAKNEVDLVGKIIGKQVQISDETDKGKCIEGIKNSRIFHYSGHAIIKPEAAYLALSDQDLAHQLTDQEISLMSNPMDMVVLSACETGLGKWEYGEGIHSLGRSFMEAGAGAAVYSLWSVNDQSTEKIMGSFYKYLKKGFPKDEALRKAKLEFLLKSKTPYSHPYHWAAFIATGDMRPVTRSFPYGVLICGSLFALSIILWIFRMK